MVSFKLGKEMEKDVFSSRHERVTKINFWVPTGNRTSDPEILRYDVLPLSHRDSKVSEVYYEVLHTARISNVDNVMFVNRIREMVSFWAR